LSTGKYINEDEVKEALLFFKELQLAGYEGFSIETGHNWAIIHDLMLPPHSLTVRRTVAGWSFQMDNRYRIYKMWAWAQKAVRRYLKNNSRFWAYEAWNWGTVGQAYEKGEHF
jgi:hypothetical protein